MGLEDVNPRVELKKLEEQVKSATELADLKPIYFRLNEIIKAFSGDFDVWVAGNDLKQLLVARGTLIQQGEISSGAPTPPAPAEPVMPAAPPSPAFQETVQLQPAAPFEPAAPPEPPPMPAAPPSPPPMATLWDMAPPMPTAPPVPPVEPAAPPPLPPPPLSSSVLDFGPSEPAPPVSRTPVAPPPALPLPVKRAAPVAAPPRPPARPAAKSSSGPMLAIAAIAVLAIGSGIVYMLLHQTHARDANAAALNKAAVPVAIATTPAGASVKVAGGPGCTANCKLSLAPGTYQISASLDGYDTAAGTVTVAAQHPASVSLTLQPSAQSVRILTDLPQGKVVVDTLPAVDLQEGQLVLDRVAPGTHTVKIQGPNGDASFSFALADARQPALTGPVNARNMIAVLVASLGRQAHLVTNAGPWKLAVNGQPQSDAGPGGTDLTGFQPGVNELVVGDGKDQRTLSENFGAAPALTAFLKTDVNAGTLIVSTGIDDVRVFVNDKEQRRPTQRGQLRLQTLGKVTVRVAKAGFLEAPPQTIEVKKGAEVRLQFDLKAQPQFGSLGVHGAVPGTEVLMDQKSIGAVGPDGSFSLANIQPGEHIVELRRDQFLPKRAQRLFVAGEEVELGGADVVLLAANGTIRIVRSPASATIMYRRGDEAYAHEARGNQVELPAGTYEFSAVAPGFTESKSRVQLAAGESREVEFTLARERPVAPPPPVARGMADFEDAPSWTRDGDNWIHKGGGFVPYKPAPKGTFTFTVELLKGGGVFRAGAIRWCFQYIDGKNYLLSEMDRKNFWTGVIKKGERLQRAKVPDSLGNQKAFTIKLDVTPDRLVQSVLVDNQWKVLDTFSEPGRDFTQGKFGFLIQGNDEIAISGFKFMPK